MFTLVKTHFIMQKMQILAAIKRAKEVSHSIPKTSKYSPNLYENPIVSLAFISPEIMNKIPTKNLEIKSKILILFCFD